MLVITDFGELDCYQAQFIVDNNTKLQHIDIRLNIRIGFFIYDYIWLEAIPYQGGL